jgi:hypothetical protein
MLPLVTVVCTKNRKVISLLNTVLDAVSTQVVALRAKPLSGVYVGDVEEKLLLINLNWS